MDVNSKKYKKHRRKIEFLSIFSIIVVICSVSLLAFTIHSVITTKTEIPGTSSTASQKPDKQTPQDTEPEFVDTYATVISTGDIMVHDPQLTGAYVSATGEYDFSDFFKEIAPYFKSADLAVANLEVTFGGNDGRKYSGYPAFNCPDSLATVIKESGINLLLTANNHSYDTGFSGFMRTQQVLNELGIEYIGTKPTVDSPDYIIKEINGIKIGIADFTYETDGSRADRKYLNGILLSEEADDLINSFSYSRIDKFYENAASIVNQMKQNGAEYILFYVHWGNEYKTEPNSWQKNIAQQLSNCGVDMIIGGHPHVIEPVELIYSEDGQNTTVCLYSAGNAVSNQRQERMDSCPSGHTEDGLLFSFTLKKTKDGVSLDNLDIIPTWVDKFLKNGSYRYTIYPLENENDGTEKFGLTGTAATKSVKSYKRTVEIIAEGLTKCQQEIGCDITFKNIPEEEQ